MFDAAAIAARWAELAAARPAGTPKSPIHSKATAADSVECRALCIAFMSAARGLGRSPESTLVIRKQEFEWRKRPLLAPRGVRSVQTFRCLCWRILGSDYALLDLGELVRLVRSGATPSSPQSTMWEAKLAVPQGSGLAALEDKMLSSLASPAVKPGEYYIENPADSILALYRH